MKITTKHLLALFLTFLIVWALVTAPAPLSESVVDSGEGWIPIQQVFQTVATENEIARTLYTKRIVGAGLKVQLKFDELWQDDNVHAGPLPALFLRESARIIAQDPIPLLLYLGSHQPISESNQFSGIQLSKFESILRSRVSNFFHEEKSNQYTAMYPDFASVAACVTCHNQHPKSPKKDWKIDDIMGATTWSYPKEKVSSAEYLEIIRAVRSGLAGAYRGYLRKIDSFSEQPEIGSRWPSEGFYIPDEATFMAEFHRLAAPATAQALLGTP